MSAGLPLSYFVALGPHLFLLLFRFLSSSFQELVLLSNRFIHTAVAYFLVGVALGMYMGTTQDFRFVHVHAHVNLLGWVSLGLAGLLYAARPALARGWLAPAHYWLHSVGLAVFMAGFAWRSATGESAIVPIAAGSLAVAVGTLLFAVNVFTRLREGSAVTPSPAS